ncbi:hypothetical protein AXG55_10140 [Silvanigrella aquatica]|uniref:Uncharacterized protein n=1 Tax=Silvanigrella aquatica TaxID=1915309 RepID=A0A1L4D223_9BACT|nr:hypothetical protein AXG55_10140 [Silvanigrella aquatica]
MKILEYISYLILQTIFNFLLFKFIILILKGNFRSIDLLNIFFRFILFEFLFYYIFFMLKN